MTNIIQSLPNTPPNILEIRGSDSELLVIIHNDGTLEYGPNYNPDEAAKIFWNALTRHNPFLIKKEE